ncbi:MAG: SpoIIE family protein phosphatase [Leptospirales bacterium]|nr:SpoIIE family protein phosphatase [Leptospirales bacterium]
MDNANGKSTTLAESEASLADRRVPWYRSLTFVILGSLALIPLWDLAGVFAIMNTRGRTLVSQQSARYITQTGNNVVSKLVQRLREIEGLCRTVAGAAPQMPRNEALYRQVLPRMLDFDGDQDVAGGGVWPEPFAFDASRGRRSFFYGRDRRGQLRYYDDYNLGDGYNREEWYSVVRYSRPGRCFWSRSYVDPFSNQPMVTCTVAMRQAGRFWGAATVDLKLEGLQALLERARRDTGGYAFLTDRNNKFITFPNPELARVSGVDRNGKPAREFMNASEFGRQEGRFAPIAAALHQMNADIMQRAAGKSDFNAAHAAQLIADSNGISSAEAQLIAAIMADPLAVGLGDSSLYTQFRMDDDFLNRSATLVYVFHVPSAYWKLVIAIPESQATAVVSSITSTLIPMMALAVVVGIVLFSLPLHRWLVRPLQRTVSAVRKAGALALDQKYAELGQHRLPVSGGELGELGRVFNEMAARLELAAEQQRQISAMKVEQAALTRELEIARRIQTSLLPPDRSEGPYAFRRVMHVAEHVGGDYFDYLQTEGENGARHWFFIGDVVGHGLEACLTVLMMHTAIHTTLSRSPDLTPGETLIAVNDSIYEGIRALKAWRYATATFLAGDGNGKISIAGLHLDLLIFRAASNHVEVISADGMWLGVEKDISDATGERSFTLDAGDILCLYSDGLTEMMAPDGSLFGEERLIESLSRSAGKSLDQVRDEVLASAATFAGKTVQNDDLTFALIQRT